MTFIYSQSFKVKQISIFKEKNYMLAANQKKKLQEKKTFAVDTKKKYSLKNGVWILLCVPG